MLYWLLTLPECCLVGCEGLRVLFCFVPFANPLDIWDAQWSYPSTDDGHGWVQGDPPSVIVTDGIGISDTPSVKTHPYGWVLYQIPPSSVWIGIGDQNPPSDIRNGWYRKMT